MKTYIAVTNSLELRASSKLAETIKALAERLLLKEHVLVSLLGIESEIKVLQTFSEVPSEESIKAGLSSLSITPAPKLSALSAYFDRTDHKMEDGHCWVFLDINQLLPRPYLSRIKLSYVLFNDLSAYPTHFPKPDWNCFGDLPASPASVDDVVDKCASDLKLVTTVVISMSKGFGFVTHPFPRLPQRLLFDDPQNMYPASMSLPEEGNGCAITTLQLVGFFPDTVLNTLHARGCTYFLQKKNNPDDIQSYTSLVTYLLTKQKIAVFLRNAGDHFAMRPFRRANQPDSEFFLLIEYISSSSIKFIETKNKAKEQPVRKFRKHTFSYETYTSFSNTDRTEMALNRVGRMIRRETDETVLKRELLLAGRHMAVSCHKELGLALAGMLKDYLEAGGFSLEIQHLFTTLLTKLNQENGLKVMVDYLETIVPNSRIKVGKY